MIPGTTLSHVDSCGLQLSECRGSLQEALWALWTWPPRFGAESECSCEDTSCAVRVLHRTQELLSGCCIHPYNSAYRDSSEAEAHSYSIYLYSIAKSAAHSGALGQQQQEKELHHCTRCSAAPARKQFCKEVLARQENKWASRESGSSEITTKKAGSGWFRYWSV